MNKLKEEKKVFGRNPLFAFYVEFSWNEGVLAAATSSYSSPPRLAL